MNLFIALAIVVVAALAFAIISSIALLGSAVISVTGSQNAYIDLDAGRKGCQIIPPSGTSTHLTSSSMRTRQPRAG
jgi:hypothetical protein